MDIEFNRPQSRRKGQRKPTMILNILLQDPTIFKEASPFGTAIYGLFVVALIGAIIYLVKRMDKKDQEYKELAEKILVLATEIKSGILDVKDHRVEVITKLTQIQTDMAKIVNK